MSDTDGDGVDDLNEILNDTNPSLPCDNNLDSDGDGLNNYFESTIGCPLNFGMGGNGTLDTYYTLWNVTDTDNGGVGDGQEYVDGTNPQSIETGMDMVLDVENFDDDSPALAFKPA